MSKTDRIDSCISRRATAGNTTGKAAPGADTQENHLADIDDEIQIRRS